MSAGIRAEVRVGSPGDCPITELSGESEESTYGVSRSVPPDAPGTVVEEFTTEAEADPGEAEEVFSYGSRNVYRFSRERGRGCACECVERFGCPVVDVRSSLGDLYLSFHAPDIERLREVVSALKDHYPSVEVQQLLHSRDDGEGSDLVFVDRARLTDRQREVLERAHRMGYFDHPKGANAGEVADSLGITTSTFTEHLAAAQTKILSSVVE